MEDVFYCVGIVAVLLVFGACNLTFTFRGERVTKGIKPLIKKILDQLR
jgi:hypothetical protein